MRRTYTPEQKQDALELYREYGGREAEKRAGISRKTISKWASLAGIPSTASKKMEAANRAKRAIDESRLHDLAADMFDDIEHLRSRLREKTVEFRGQQAKRVEYEEPPADAVKNLVIAMATLTDKLLLLTGKATGRQEVGFAGELAKMSNEELIEHGRQSLRKLELIQGGGREK